MKKNAGCWKDSDFSRLFRWNWNLFHWDLCQYLISVDCLLTIGISPSIGLYWIRNSCRSFRWGCSSWYWCGRYCWSCCWSCCWSYRCRCRGCSRWCYIWSCGRRRGCCWSYCRGCGGCRRWCYSWSCGRSRGCCCRWRCNGSWCYRGCNWGCWWSLWRGHRRCTLWGGGRGLGLGCGLNIRALGNRCCLCWGCGAVCRCVLWGRRYCSIWISGWCCSILRC